MAENEVNQVTDNAATGASTPAPEVAPSTELDGLSEFTFQGEKLTPDQLHQLMTEHKSYAQQVKDYSENKKYYDNLDADLDNVLNDPTLADKFRQAYPPQFHTYLDKILRSSGQAKAPSTNAQPSLPKEFLNEFGEVKRTLHFMQQDNLRAQTEAASAKLDAILPKLWEKFPMAIEDQVLTRAESVLASGQKLTEATWERLARESHAAAQKKADQFYGAKLKEQQAKGQKGSDVGPGGATPGSAPVKPRTFDEAQEAMLKHVRSQRNG